MGRKGERKSLKRESAPKIWPIHRKEATWTYKVRPGPHPASRSLPLALILRDILDFGKYNREVRRIIYKGMVKVDGRPIKDLSFPVGVMDVISIPDVESIYRVFPSKKGLTLHPIGKEEEEVKLCRIESKRILRGGRLQLNLHDGRNIILPSEEEGRNYVTKDVLKITVPDQSLMDTIKLADKAYSMILGGKNMGLFGRIVEIERKTGRKATFIVTVRGEDGSIYKTILDYIFVLGQDKPAISIPRGGDG